MKYCGFLEVYIIIDKTGWNQILSRYFFWSNYLTTIKKYALYSIYMHCMNVIRTYYIRHVIYIESDVTCSQVWCIVLLSKMKKEYCNEKKKHFSLTSCFSCCLNITKNNMPSHRTKPNQKPWLKKLSYALNHMLTVFLHP